MKNFNSRLTFDLATFKTSIPSSKNNNSAIKQTTSFLQQTEEEVIDPIFKKSFVPGSVYDPFDFSLTKLRIEQKENSNRVLDGIHIKHPGVDPLTLWKYPSILGNFVNSNGKIRLGVLYGHSGKTHKRLSKAIRRARAAGLLSYFTN